MSLAIDTATCKCTATSTCFLCKVKAHDSSECKAEHCYECRGKTHPSLDDCPDLGCDVCGMFTCLLGAPEHFDKDECYACLVKSPTQTLDLVPIAAWRGSYICKKRFSYTLAQHVHAHVGKDKRAGVYGAFLLACYDDKTKEYQSIGKVESRFLQIAN